MILFKSNNTDARGHAETHIVNTQAQISETILRGKKRSKIIHIKIAFVVRSDISSINPLPSSSTLRSSALHKVTCTIRIPGKDNKRKERN